jgi:predicted RNA methylase
MNSPTLRFRTPRNTADQLGQVFTPSSVSRLLAAALPCKSRQIIDMGAGQGALATAALAQCTDANAILIEQDPIQVDFLRRLDRRRFAIISADALAPGLIERSIDNMANLVVVSNPPYGMIRINRSLLKEESLLNTVVDGAGWVRGDAAFVSRIWEATGNGTTLGLIVASPIICAGTFKSFRKTIVQRMNNLVVTELHPRAFSGAEVRTFLLTGSRTVNRSRRVTLRLANEHGEIIKEMQISHLQAVQRLDYLYHSTVEDFKLRPGQLVGNLEDLKATIARGSRSPSEFRKLGHLAFHTSDFVKTGKLIKFPGAPAGFNSAKAGDILIPRVGSRCLLREAKVISGTGLITDCVYRIRAPMASRGAIWRTLNSDFGREWRNRFSEGSCARYLTISSINSLPILL